MTNTIKKIITNNTVNQLNNKVPQKNPQSTPAIQSAFKESNQPEIEVIKEVDINPSINIKSINYENLPQLLNGNLKLEGENISDLIILSELNSIENIDIEKINSEGINNLEEYRLKVRNYLNKLHELDDNNLLKQLDKMSKEQVEHLIKTLEEYPSDEEKLSGIIQGLKKYDEYRSSCILCENFEDIQSGSTPEGENPTSFMTPLRRMEAVALAYSQLGRPYNMDRLWNLDKVDDKVTCNGLTYWAYRKTGIPCSTDSNNIQPEPFEGTVDLFKLPQGSSEQMQGAPIITLIGKIEEKTPGDIIAFDNGEGKNINNTSFKHVAMYVGDGQFIESTTRGNLNMVTKATLSEAYDNYSYSVSW